MDGIDKLPPLIIGKSKNLRSSNMGRLQECYKSNKRAWMTSQLFEEWLNKLDKQFSTRKRKIAMVIAMVVDTCPPHPKMDDLKAIGLIFLPPQHHKHLTALRTGHNKSLQANLQEADGAQLPASCRGAVEGQEKV
ncbi:hypothetical protein RRG08_056302 [Elysia crispata]|uniref:DDE-1 domain-containing protein n=1 Tax=Elysia crispata TaxID=231223 RepID=A0AAE1AWK3_9GAST|nr:hypothetical protein RRG08_056302 [Elysia crispata]